MALSVITKKENNFLSASYSTNRICETAYQLKECNFPSCDFMHDLPENFEPMSESELKSKSTRKMFSEQQDLALKSLKSKYHDLTQITELDRQIKSLESSPHSMLFLTKLEVVRYLHLSVTSDISQVSKSIGANRKLNE